MITKIAIPTAEGPFTAHYSEHGLARLDFPQSSPRSDHPAQGEIDRVGIRQRGSRSEPPGRHLFALSAPSEGGERDRGEVRARFMERADLSSISAQIRHWHDLTIRALNEALAGRVPRDLPPLDLSAGTDFQRRVWSALRRIAAGHTRSYGEVASEIGKPRASRAVGAACGANPIPVLVPCHRVLAANRALGGFSGGLGWKRKLLAREGVIPF